MTDPAHGWGVERSNAAGGPPFLLVRMFTDQKAACDWILEYYGARPNRKAALRRHRRQEGIRAVRVVLRPHGGNLGEQA